jgi:hypothetical protein
VQIEKSKEDFIGSNFKVNFNTKVLCIGHSRVSCFLCSFGELLKFGRMFLDLQSYYLAVPCWQHIFTPDTYVTQLTVNIKKDMEDNFNKLPIIDSDHELFKEQTEIYKECLMSDLTSCAMYEDYRLRA